MAPRHIRRQYPLQYPACLHRNSLALRARPWLLHSWPYFTAYYFSHQNSLVLMHHWEHTVSICSPYWTHSIAIAVLLHLSTQNIGHKCFCYNWLLLTVIIILIHSRLGDQGESGDLFLCLFSCEEFDSFPPLLQCMAHPLSFLCEQFWWVLREW